MNRDDPDSQRRRSKTAAVDVAADVIALVDADPSWPARFIDEVAAIRAALGPDADALRFEHVGSTAVAGLAAKPIIDVLVIPPADAWPGAEFVRALETLGYVHWADNPDPHHVFLVKGMPPFGAARTHHVHVRPSIQAAPVLAFRNYLRAHRDTAVAYQVLKRELAAAHPTDREAYTRGKTAFVARALRDAEGLAR